MSDPDDPLLIPEYRPGAGVALTDAERWPTLKPAGAARLAALRAHPDAPEWVHRTGDRLDADAIDRVRRPLSTDDWLRPHLRRAAGTIAYRDRVPAEPELGDFPTVRRADLIDDVAAYVPFDVDLSRVVAGSSSGTTGRALEIPDDVEDTARTFELLRTLVAGAGVDWRPDPGRLALAYVVSQRQAFSYASVLSTFGQAVMARLNLDPSAWGGGGQDRAAAERRRERFLRAQRPQVISGDPLALSVLLTVDGVAPAAVVSSAMTLSPALRHRLERRYRCPVLDLYGLHETRPIAVSGDGGAHVLLDRRVHVEVFDAERDVPLPRGETGELVVTAGENPWLPLVRYRTGDAGRLVRVNGRDAIADLEGRGAVSFVTADGRAVPSVEVTQQMQRWGAEGWRLHQDRTGTIRGTVAGGDAARIESALTALSGASPELVYVASLPQLPNAKAAQYTRD